MKKRLYILVAVIICVCMAASLAACGGKKDENNGGGSSALTTAQNSVNALSNSSDATTCNSNISTALGVSISLPTGTAVSGSKSLADIAGLQSYASYFPSYDGMVSYYVKVDGTSSTEASYYASIKPQMTAAGWTALDEDYGFYKVEGTMARSLAIVDVGDTTHNLVIVASVIDSTKFSAPGGDDNGSGGDNPGGGEGAVWPTATIAEIIGANMIPAYTGTCTRFTTATNSITKSVTVTVTGGTSDGATTYKAALVSAGFTLTDEIYVKTLANEDQIKVVVMAVPQTEQTAASVSITAYFVKNSGALAAWPTSQLAAVYSEKAIPAISGASSFDYSNTYGAVVITAYGITAEELSAYQSALVTASFSANGDEYAFELANHDTLKIALTYLSSSKKLIITPSVEKFVAPAFTLPTNVKIVYSTAYADGTFIKIGDDYFGESMGERTFLKKTATGWTKYVATYEMDDVTYEYAWSGWTEDGTFTASNINHEIENISDELIRNAEVDEDSDYVKQADTSVVCGATCDVYVYEFSGYSYTVFYNPTNGLTYKHVTSAGATQLTYEITTFNTTVTTFGVTVPQ